MSKIKNSVFLFLALFIVCFSNFKETNNECRYCVIQLKDDFSKKVIKKKIIHCYKKDTIIDKKRYSHFLLKFQTDSEKDDYDFIRVDRKNKKIFYRFNNESYKIIKIWKPKIAIEQVLFDYSKTGATTTVFTNTVLAEGISTYIGINTSENDTVYTFLYRSCLKFPE